MRPQLIAALIIVATLALLWLVTWPFWQGVQQERDIVFERQQQVAAEQEANVRLQRFEQELENREVDIKKLEVSVSERPDSAVLIASFEEAAINNGLILEGINLLDAASTNLAALVASDSTFEPLGVQVQVAGTYGSFQTFLADIERSFPLLDLASADFSSGDDGSGQVVNEEDPELQFEATFISYHLR